MATTKAEFQSVAQELFDDEFADFLIACTFDANDGAYDPVTGTQGASTTEAVNCLREEYSASQLGNDLIQVGDFKLLAEVQDFSSINPNTDGLSVSFNGRNHSVIRAEKDPAEAVWTLQVRAS